MALATLTLATGQNGGNAASEPVFHEEVSLVGDASYPTGGSTGLQTLYRAKGVPQSGRTILTVSAVDCFGYQVAWDSANSKLKFYHGDNNNASDGPAVEVPNATDLSAVTFKLLIVSQ